jgi:hypothetical protein
VRRHAISPPPRLCADLVAPPPPAAADDAPAAVPAPPLPAAQPGRALVADGRLVLLVNLEGTLIDVAKPSSVDKWPHEQQHQLHLTVASQSPADTSLLQLPGSWLWIKLRPGWQECMRLLSACYALKLVRAPAQLLHEPLRESTETITLSPAQLLHEPPRVSMAQRDACAQGQRARARGLLQVSDLKPEVVAQIRLVMDPHGRLFDSVVESSMPADAKKKPVRRLATARGFPALQPLALVLDNKLSQLWHPADMERVLHCERYCFFPRPSMVRPSTSHTLAPPTLAHVQHALCAARVAAPHALRAAALRTLRAAPALSLRAGQRGSVPAGRGSRRGCRRQCAAAHG